MKSFQQNLLIVMALALCVLCVYQWYGQSAQRAGLRALEGLVDQKSAAIQGYTNSIRNMDQQIAQMDLRLTELKAQARTNADLMMAQRREINRLQITSEGLTNEIAQYTNAVATLEGRLKDAYAGIEKQNAAIKDIAAQRDEFVKKYNDLVKDRNDVVNKYNDLVQKVEKSQSSAK